MPTHRQARVQIQIFAKSELLTGRSKKRVEWSRQVLASKCLVQSFETGDLQCFSYILKFGKFHRNFQFQAAIEEALVVHALRLDACNFACTHASLFSAIDLTTIKSGLHAMRCCRFYHKRSRDPGHLLVLLCVANRHTSRLSGSNEALETCPTPAIITLNGWQERHQVAAENCVRKTLSLSFFQIILTKSGCESEFLWRQELG